jgi:hypothetical protein
MEPQLVHRRSLCSSNVRRATPNRRSGDSGEGGLVMATIFVIALRVGAVAGSLVWYWRLPLPLRQAADARTRNHIATTYGTSIWKLTPEQARAVYRWARAQHA